MHDMAFLFIRSYTIRRLLHEQMTEDLEIVVICLWALVATGSSILRPTHRRFARSKAIYYLSINIDKNIILVYIKKIKVEKKIKKKRRKAQWHVIYTDDIKRALVPTDISTE
jgi:hypothetical protein